MKKAMILTAAGCLILSALFAVGCGKTGPNSYKISGSTLTVRLAANPTTGYVWSSAIEDENILSFESEVYEGAPSKEGMVGVGGTSVFTLKAKDAGNCDVVFVYGRPWEEDGQTEQVSLTVIVNEKGKIDSVSIAGSTIEITG